MATFGEMQANIAGYLGRSDLTTSIQEAIRRACRHYERELFWFNESEDSFVTVAGTKNYTLSSSYAYLSQVIVNQGSNRYQINKEDYEVINSIDTSGYQGQPDWYAERNGIVRLYPVPNATYTASYVYAAKAATLSASADVNVFLQNAEDLIEARALWWLSVFKTRNPSAPVFKQAELEALNKLQSENTNKLGVGRIRPSKF